MSQSQERILFPAARPTTFRTSNAVRKVTIPAVDLPLTLLSNSPTNLGTFQTTATIETIAVMLIDLGELVYPVQTLPLYLGTLGLIPVDVDGSWRQPAA